MNLEWLYDLVLSGQPFVEQVQAMRSPLLDQLFRLITFTGDLEFYLLVLPAAFWIIDKKLARHLVFILILTFFVNGFIKNTFQIPRPPQSLWLIDETGFGFVSGHSQGAVVLWGYVAWHYRRYKWVWIAAAAMALAGGFSRIYLGVHYPADVVGGLLVGVLVLWLYISFSPALVRRVDQGSFGLIAAYLAIFSMMVLWLQPGDGVEYPYETAVTMSGFVMGAGLGLWLERRRINFAQSGTLWQYAGRYVLGLVLVFTAWEGTSQLADRLTIPFALVVTIRYFRYVLVGLVMTYVVPWLFVRLGLAETRQLRSGN